MKCKIVSIKNLNFATSEDNRSIDKNQVKKLKNDFLEDKEFINGITVNEKTNVIIDGQHRVAAVKELYAEGKISGNETISVTYIYHDKKDEIKCVLKANNSTKTWTTFNFLETNSKKNKNYKNFALFGDKHEDLKNKKGTEYKVAYIAAFLNCKNIRKTLKDNSLIVTEKAMAEGEIVYSEVQQVLNSMGRPKLGNEYENLIWAYRELREMDNFNLKTFLAIVKNNPKVLSECKTLNRWRLTLKGLYELKKTRKYVTE